MSATVFEITAISCNFLKLCGFYVCSVFVVTPPIDLLMIYEESMKTITLQNLSWILLDFCALASILINLVFVYDPSY